MKSHFKGTIQKSQNHGNAVSHNDKNVMEAVNENFVWNDVFLTNAWKRPVMNCDGSRQADCSMHVDQRQWRRGHLMSSVVSPAQQEQTFSKSS